MYIYNKICDHINISRHNEYEILSECVSQDKCNIDVSTKPVFKCVNKCNTLTDADKCKKLRQEYTRWNRQTNNSNEKIRNQAKKMVDLTAHLRKKYNC